MRILIILGLLGTNNRSLKRTAKLKFHPSLFSIFVPFHVIMAFVVKELKVLHVPEFLATTLARIGITFHQLSSTQNGPSSARETKAIAFRWN